MSARLVLKNGVHYDFTGAAVEDVKALVEGSTGMLSIQEEGRLVAWFARDLVCGVFALQDATPVAKPAGKLLHLLPAPEAPAAAPPADLASGPLS